MPTGKVKEDYLEVKKLVINGASLTGGVLLSATQAIDLAGVADSLVLDDDGDTTLSAPTDDQIDVEIAGADDFTFTANTFTALSGSTIATNTIAETTATSGVTIDGVLVKDGGIVCADAATLEVDTVNEATGAAGVTIDGVLVKDGGIVMADGAAIDADTINEATAGAGVTADGVLLKDGASTHLTPVIAVTGDGAISVPNGNTTYFITENAAGAAITLVDPTATTHHGLTRPFIATTAQAHALDNSAGSGFNNVGAGGDVGTFGGAVADMLQIMAYQGVWYITINTNVTLG